MADVIEGGRWHRTPRDVTSIGRSFHARVERWASMSVHTADRVHASTRPHARDDVKLTDTSRNSISCEYTHVATRSAQIYFRHLLLSPSGDGRSKQGESSRELRGHARRLPPLARLLRGRRHPWRWTKPRGGLRPGYELKLNSYDLAWTSSSPTWSVNWAPEVRAVILSSGNDRVFCAGANINMLGRRTRGR